MQITPQKNTHIERKGRAVMTAHVRVAAVVRWRERRV